MNEFYEGQIFENEIPYEVFDWCNEGQLYHIEELEPEGTHLEETGEYETVTAEETEMVETGEYENIPTDELDENGEPIFDFVPIMEERPVTYQKPIMKEVPTRRFQLVANTPYEPSEYELARQKQLIEQSKFLTEGPAVQDGLDEAVCELFEEHIQYQEETDAAICELFESQLQYQDDNDAAICELYELIIGGVENGD